MEKLKDPAMMLSVANTVGLVGTTVYFYKQHEAIRLDMIKMSQTLQGVLRKIAEMEKGEQHKGEALHTLNDQIKRINDEIEDISQLGDVENLKMDLSEVVAVLSENNINVERPSETTRYTRRSGDRKASRRDSDVDERDRREQTRRPNQRASESSKPEINRDVERDRTQSKRSSSVREPRSSQQTSSLYEEDDADLIGEVRRQQTRN
jgi:TolA-binding protein